ncbi:hypothetical protein BGW41_003508 [Actinomortierella wolfii]|nr:hypothetical protein BGW41_003508 [Actinomortierella wolfii]
MVETTPGTVCGKQYKKNGGTQARMKHIVSDHQEMYDALLEFRHYHSMVQSIYLPKGYDEMVGENGARPTGRRTRFEMARDEIYLNALERPRPHEQENFEILLIQLVEELGSFDLIQSKDFKGMTSLLNPFYEIPSTETLRRKWAQRSKVTEQRSSSISTSMKKMAPLPQMAREGC